MREFFASLIALHITMAVSAQETVIWATDVVDISSEYSPFEYSAMQALLKPNVLPRGGEDPNAWRPKNPDKESFIVVSFDNPINAQQVAIAESENPGAVKAVYAYDVEMNEHLLFEITPRIIPLESRLLNLFFEPTDYKIEAIKVVLSGDQVPGYNSIDAVGISASNIPIAVLIKIARNVNEDLSAKRLDENVNSEYTEHSPILSPDGTRLYFSRQFHPDNVGGTEDSEDIWVSELDPKTNNWLQAVNVGPPLNNKGPNFISSISIVGDKEVLVLGNRYGPNDRMYTGVSISMRDGDSFTKPQPVNIENEYNYSPNADFFMVPGGEALLISAERDDTRGLRDLYVSFRKNDSLWSEPKNLGADINTMGEEEAPFLAEDGKTLYFSSNGYSGYGGQDIYLTVRQDESWTSWSEPTNMGAGINKAGDDEYFSIPSQGQFAYFTRGSGGDDMDIFNFRVDDLIEKPEGPVYESLKHLTSDSLRQAERIVALSGQVLDAETGAPVAGASVVIQQLPNGSESARVMTDENGKYAAEVLSGEQYAVSSSAPGFVGESENLDLRAIGPGQEIMKNLKLIPSTSDMTLAFNNVFFGFDQANLQTESMPELKRILDMLRSGEIKGLEIKGYADAIGTEVYNKRLSTQRAKAVYKWFVDKGIGKDRLTYEGFGETNPVAANDSPANRQKNRRVEFNLMQ